MKFENKESLMKYVLENTDIMPVTGVTSLVLQNFLPFFKEMDFPMSKGESENSILSTFEGIEDSFLYYLFKENDCKLNQYDCEDLVDELSSYIGKMKSFDTLIERIKDKNFKRQFPNIPVNQLLVILNGVKSEYE